MILGYYPKRGSLLIKLYQLEPVNTLNFDPNEVNHIEPREPLLEASSHHPIRNLGQR